MTDADVLIEWLDKKIDEVRHSLSTEIRYVVERFDDMENAHRQFVTWSWFRALAIACGLGFGLLLGIIISVNGAAETARATPQALKGVLK